jgi:hypothetical protein
MKVKITNTTDHKFEGSIIEFNGEIDDLFLSENIHIELIEVIIHENTIKLISDNYIVDGEIEE